jgi:hypothetical protein
LGLTEISPEIEAKPKSLNYVRIYASLCVRQPLLDLTKQMAVEAVMSEPLSRPIPCYQGLIQGFFMGLQRILLALSVNPHEFRRFTAPSSKLGPD